MVKGKVSKIKVIKLYGQWLLGRTYNDRGVTRLYPLLESGYFRSKAEATEALDEVIDNAEKIDILPPLNVRPLPKLGG